jgi:hypothetical protein
MSSPFPQGEKREDEIYSAYSPYGDGTAATYNSRKGGAEEVSFYKDMFNKCVVRTERIPGYAAKKTWFEITTELTRYNTIHTLYTLYTLYTIYTIYSLSPLYSLDTHTT